MEYLIKGSADDRLGCFVWVGNCTCNTGSTYNNNCGLKYDQNQACPDHCWSNLCTSADVDPFIITK